MGPKAKKNPNSNMPHPAEKTDEQPWDFTHVSLIILAGGKSLRMGMNKAHLDWHDSRFIDVLVEKGRSLAFGEILLSGYDGEIKGCKTVPDVKPNRGPLGGMYSCFMASSFRNALVVPVDCPGISVTTLIGIAMMHLHHRNEITLLQHGEKIEPLIGMYDTLFKDKILPVIEHGGAPVFRALDRGHIDIYHMKDDEAGVLNLNTREAYLAWVKENENHRRDKNAAGD